MYNKRINSFATAHSDRHKAAAVYASRYSNNQINKEVI